MAFDPEKAEGFESTVVDKLDELIGEVNTLSELVAELIVQVGDLELTQNDGFSTEGN